MATEAQIIHEVATADAEENERRRERFEGVVRIVDLVIYAITVACGFYAVLATPMSVVDVLTGAEWLVGLWAALLLVGGTVGFIGRLSRYWMVEIPGTVLAFAGMMIYFVMLGRFAFTSITASVASGMVLATSLVMFRRWIELQIFSSEPGDGSLGVRLAFALRRRTTNFNRKS